MTVIDHLFVEARNLEVLASNLANQIIDYGHLAQERPLTEEEWEDMRILNVEWREAHETSKSYVQTNLVISICRLNSFRKSPKGI